MSGELFEVKDNVLSVVSLDGHRISMRKVNLKGDNLQQETARLRNQNSQGRRLRTSGPLHWLWRTEKKHRMQETPVKSRRAAAEKTFRCGSPARLF